MCFRGSSQRSDMMSTLASSFAPLSVQSTNVSGTTNITWYSVNLFGEHIHIIDTPGFDDSSLSDSDILQMLVTELAAMYQNDKHLTGLLYIHDITEVRMKSSVTKAGLATP